MMEDEWMDGELKRICLNRLGAVAKSNDKFRKDSEDSVRVFTKTL